MADVANRFIRATKQFYKESKVKVMQGKMGVDQFIFNTDDIDLSATMQLDRLIRDPYGVSFRDPNASSAVRPYTAGTGTIYEVPHSSEKTPISEELRDAVIAGVEETANYFSHNDRLLMNIIEEHTEAHIATRWKKAIDVIRTGKFTPTNSQGQTMSGLEIDFSRDASLDAAYDFTAGGATVDQALKNVFDALIAQGAPRTNMTFILGGRWLQELESDANVLERMTANQANQTIALNRMAPEFFNTQNLYLVGQYRIPGTVNPVNICGYSADSTFKSYNGAAGVEYLPEDEMIALSFGSPAFRVFRGVDALDDAGNPVRLSGEIVFDSFTENDPVTQMLRSQTRYAFIPGNVDHTARFTGTFEEES